MAITGQCKLCLRHDQVLKDSHIVPAWVYKRCQWQVNEKWRENPVWVQGEVAFQTSWQDKEELLCADCESQLSIWEKYVSRIAFTDDGLCPAYSLLGVSPTVHSFPSNEQLRCVPARELDNATVAKFAVSVIWRAYAASRSTGRQTLGAKYGEMFRKYLMGEAAFPERSCLILELLNQGQTSSSKAGQTSALQFHTVGMFPDGYRTRGGFCVHRFYASGLYFKLLVGLFPAGLRDVSLFPGTGFVLFEPPDLMDMFPAMIARAKKARVAPKMQARFDALRQSEEP